MRQRAGARAVRAAAVVALLGVLSACSTGDDDPTLDGAIPTTRVTETTSSSSTSTTSTTAAAACPPVERAHDREGVLEQPADVDGDGQPDVVQSFPDGDHVTLLVDLGAGGGARTEIASREEAAVGLLGAEVLDPHDAREVIWVRVGAGASTTVLGLYHLDGCTLVAATFENGDPVEIPIGGTVGTASGARCGSQTDPDADLLVYEATLITGREYEIVTTEYRWEDGQLARSPKSAPGVSRSDDLSQASAFECGDLAL
ncbi:MAG: hypothetical protein ACJ739_13085 [Acidimicrobiales bacterium]